MTIFLFGILLVGVLAYVTQPLIQNKTRFSFLLSVDHQKTDIQQRKHEVLAAIKEIEFEYQLGKLSQKDYQKLRQEYEAKAIEVLKGMKGNHGHGIGQTNIEASVLEYRKKLRERNDE